MVIGNAVKEYRTRYQDEPVSVPLRGNGYRKSRSSLSIVGRTDGVSVPLRGNGYRKFVLTLKYKRQGKPWFPSPCGVMVIGNFDDEND